MTKGYNYDLVLTPQEHEALMWIADRYCSAQVLADCVRWEYHEGDDGISEGPDGRPALGHVVEPTWIGRVNTGTMWGYIGALDALEDHDPDNIRPVPPCAGGTLADKLIDMLNAFPGTPEGITP